MNLFLHCLATPRFYCPLTMVPSYETLFGKLTTPSERALIKFLASPGILHAGILSQASALYGSKATFGVCRAIATAIVDIHPAKSQETIPQMGRKSIRKDVEFVGGYDSIPLFTIVCTFDE